MLLRTKVLQVLQRSEGAAGRMESIGLREAIGGVLLEKRDAQRPRAVLGYWLCCSPSGGRGSDTCLTSR